MGSRDRGAETGEQSRGCVQKWGHRVSSSICKQEYLVTNFLAHCACSQMTAKSLEYDFGGQIF